MFKINHRWTMDCPIGSGFQITFDNGLTASVQFSHGNYCSNQLVDMKLSEDYDYASETAEIAVIRDRRFMPIDEFYDGYSDGEVAGWVTADMVADFLKRVKEWGE